MNRVPECLEEDNSESSKCRNRICKSGYYVKVNRNTYHVPYLSLSRKTYRQVNKVVVTNFLTRNVETVFGWNKKKYDGTLSSVNWNIHT